MLNGLEGVVCQLESSFLASETAIRDALKSATQKNRSSIPELDDPVNEQLERQGVVYNEGVCFFEIYVNAFFPYQNEDGAKDFFTIFSETTYGNPHSLDELQTARYDLYEIDGKKTEKLKEKTDIAQKRYKPNSLARRILSISPYALLFNFKEEL